MEQPTRNNNAGFRLACCLPLATLPLCHMITAWSFMVYSSQLPRLFGLSPSGITPELNSSQLYAIYRVGQSSRVIDLLARHCLPLGHPSVASGACAVEQISSSKRQYCERQAILIPALVIYTNSPPFIFMFSTTCDILTQGM